MLVVQDWREYMEEANKLIPHKHAECIKAWADGYEIQYKAEINPFGNTIWKFTDNPTWDKDIEFRVKPKPKLRPFTYDEVVKLKDCWLITKLPNHLSHTKDLCRIQFIREYQQGFAVVLVTVIAGDINNILVSSKTLLSDYTLTNGDPCGVEEIQ